MLWFIRVNTRLNSNWIHGTFSSALIQSLRKNRGFKRKSHMTCGPMICSQSEAIEVLERSMCLVNSCFLESDSQMTYCSWMWCLIMDELCNSFIRSQPSSVLTQTSPGERQSLPMKGMIRVAIRPQKGPDRWQSKTICDTGVGYSDRRLDERLAQR